MSKIIYLLVYFLGIMIAMSSITTFSIVSYAVGTLMAGYAGYMMGAK